MKQILKNIGVLVLILLVVAAIFAQFENSSEEVESVPFSTFVQEVRDGEVESVSVEDSSVNITLQSGAKQKTRKEPQASLTETLANFGVSQENIQSFSLEVKESSDTELWVNILIGLLPILLIIGFFWFIMKRAQNQQMGALNFGKSKAKVASFKDKNKATFDDVANLKEAKAELVEVVDFLQSPQKYMDMGAKIPKGILMTGAPGTGKTLLARAVAGEAEVPFFHISGSEFVEMFVGVGASRVRDLFESAKKSAPAIIFIDEIDAVGRKRGAGIGGGHDEREQTLNQILTEMDGFDKETNVIVIAATNRPDVLDPALLRPGRFDRRVVLDLPDIKAREQILKLHSDNKNLKEDVNLREVAERTPGFSGADLENTLNEAAILAAKNGQEKINQENLFTALEKVMLGSEKKSKVFTKREKKIAAYHEAGHALVSEMLELTDPVRKVSIISRGGAGGYTLKLPSEERHYRSFPEFKEELSVLLGGYSAEELTFNEVTTGASNDLKKATKLARNVVTKYGMSKKIGPVAFSDSKEHAFLGEEIAEKRNFSEKTAAEIDSEIKSLINEAHKKTKKLLKNNQSYLEKLAQRLLEKETVERKELLKILDMDDKLEKENEEKEDKEE